MSAPTYLSPEWLADAHDPLGPALASAGRALRVTTVVTGAPDGEVRFTTAVAADGAVTDASEDDGEPDVVLTTPYKNAVAILLGEADHNASFMRGQTKVVGRTGPLLQVLEATKLPAFEAARADLVARTTF